MPTPEKARMMSECYFCRHQRTVPYNCHIKCVMPDADMTGNKHGIEKGWFMYPELFDPIWKTRLCANFESESTVNRAISQPISPATAPDSQG